LSQIALKKATYTVEAKIKILLIISSLKYINFGLLILLMQMFGKYQKTKITTP